MHSLHTTQSRSAIPTPEPTQDQLFMSPPMVTTSPVQDDDDEGDDGTPAALVLGASLIGGSILIVLVSATVFIACFAKGQMRKRRTHQVNEGRQRRANDTRKPLYTEVIKPPRGPPPLLERRTESPLVNGKNQTASEPSLIVSKHQPATEPREIMAYMHNAQMPETFQPFPPPKFVANGNRVSVGNIYDIPDDLTDAPIHIRGPYDTPDGELSSSYTLSESYYDHVESVHDDSVRLSTSLQHLPQSAPGSRNGSFRQPPGTYASKSFPRQSISKFSPDYDHIYNENLEPSMLYHTRSFDSSMTDTSGVALPYGPLYDVPRPLRKSEAPLNISRQDVVEIRDLGTGHFGKVVLAATTGMSLKDLRIGEDSDNSISFLVAIKKLREDADAGLKEAFEKEIEFMSRLKNANVVRLLGVCRSGESFIVMEYMENGDLHDFLQRQKLVPDTVNLLSDNEVTPLILLYMAVQLASGMRYLASRRFIHRDLATRNCLVGQDFVVKISDFGMSRNLYDSYYYRVQGRLILPIRWMATESFYGKFSVKSDVWSYGITIWEIFNLAQNEPYEEMTDEELINDAIKGEKRMLLSKPKACPSEVYDVMLRCWVHDLLIRADFEEIYSRLFLLYTKLSKQYSTISE